MNTEAAPLFACKVTTKTIENLIEIFSNGIPDHDVDEAAWKSRNKVMKNEVT